MSKSDWYGPVCVEHHFCHVTLVVVILQAAPHDAFWASTVAALEHRREAMENRLMNSIRSQFSKTYACILFQVVSCVLGCNRKLDFVPQVVFHSEADVRGLC